MKRALVIAMVVVLGVIGVYVFSGSSDGSREVGESVAASDGAETITYQKISVEEAREIMDGEEPFVLLDVRTKEEFAEGRIAGAKLLPGDEIRERAAAELPDKDVLILVYCRSGGRSAKATQELVELGYTKVRDMGGILDWPFEVEGDEL
jgi:rhodanese-related sulfurtransferase